MLCRSYRGNSLKLRPFHIWLKVHCLGIAILNCFFALQVYMFLLHMLLCLSFRQWIALYGFTVVSMSEDFQTEKQKK